MFEFDIENLTELNHRIAESKKTETIYNLEFVSTFLEIKESLLGADFEQTWDAKVEGLQNYTKLIELYKSEQIADHDGVCRELAYQKFVETFVFLRTRYVQSLRGQQRVGKDPFSKEPVESDEERVSNKIRPKEALFFELLSHFFSTSENSEEEIKRFINKDFLKSDDVDEELRKNFGVNIVEDKRTAWNEEILSEIAAKKELKELVQQRLLGLRVEVAPLTNDKRKSVDK